MSDLYDMIFSDPCVMLGCIHEYGHSGKHEYEPGQLEEFQPTPTYADLVKRGVIRHVEAQEVESEGYERALASLRKYGP